MSKTIVKKSNETVCQTSLLDLFQTITDVCFQSCVAYDLIKDHVDKNCKNENENEKNRIIRTYMELIIGFEHFTHQLIGKSNGQDSTLIVSGHSNLCCYLGKKCNHHIFEITELICNIVRERLPSNKLQRQDYILTDLGTLHQQTTNIDQDLAETIDKLCSKDNWTERRDQIDGWEMERWVYGKVKEIIDSLINDNNHGNPVLLLNPKFPGKSYYLGCGIELHTIQVDCTIYNSIVNDIKKHDSVII